MSVEAVAPWHYLRSYLAPIDQILARPDVTDIYINRPGELWIETLGGTIEQVEESRLDRLHLARLARQVAAYSSQGVNREQPLLSAALPDGARVQIVLPPATRGDIAIAIRKHVAASLTLEDYSFADPDPSSAIGLQTAEGPESVAVSLRRAVRARANIVVAGGTSTGKTTFLSALLAEVPPQERLILIEDTPELKLSHRNAVGLIATRGDQGEARVTANDLVAASLRMRPDRIILGELRGGEALAFLRAVNTGHPGSMTTVHANSPEGAVEQIALLILQAGTRLTRSDIHDYIASTIGVYVQLARVGGRRYVSAVRFAGSGGIKT